MFVCSFCGLLPSSCAAAAFDLRLNLALANSCISGLVVEYIVAIDVTRVRFPADAFAGFPMERHE